MSGTFRRLALNMYRNGWTGIVPAINHSKRPLLSGEEMSKLLDEPRLAGGLHTQIAQQPLSEAQVERLAVVHPGASIAHTGNGIIAIDVDLDDEKLCGEVDRTVQEIAGPTLRRLSVPGRVLLPYRVPDPYRPAKHYGPAVIASAKIDGQKERSVEIIRPGYIWLVYGTHPSGSEYRWQDDLGPAVVPVGDLPTINADALVELREAVAEIVGRPRQSDALETGHYGSSGDITLMRRQIEARVDPWNSEAVTKEAIRILCDASPGSRHNTLLALVGAMLQLCCTQGQLDRLREVFPRRVGEDRRPGVAEDEFDRIIRDLGGAEDAGWDRWI